MNGTIDSMFDRKPYAKLWKGCPVGPMWPAWMVAAWRRWGRGK